jgi:predicted nucleic acid-binding protein
VIVVADTSVVLNLCCVRQETLLSALFGRVLVPAEVAAEFSRLVRADVRFAGLTLPAWIEMLSAPSPPGWG